MLNRRLTFLALIALLAIPAAAQAHFLWIVTESDGKSQVAKVYFSESATPDDPKFLDKVAKAQAWAIGDRRGQPTALKLEKKDDALVADLGTEQKHAPVVVKQTYGVLTRGEESFLLNYYAKGYPFALPGSWRAIGDAELLPLEVVAKVEPAGVALKVLWQGEPQAGATVTVEGPGISTKLEGTTDEKGVFQTRLADAGLYSIRAKHVEARAGEHDGMAYQSVRHYTTLSLPYSPATLRTASHNLPDLSKGITSFGGAIYGDWLYVYGGHFGRAHEYSSDEQSGDFLRLNLRDPQGWETLPGGPKLTGTTLVAHGGKVYRLGGFTAKNTSDQPESLWSQNDFARFDPATKQWESLPSLPDGRSSHDAVVLGNTLYVVGGWEMKDAEKKWHDTTLAFDLSASPASWRSIPQSFQRRALSVAAFNNRLYALGGMQPKGGATTATSVYDPEKNAWSDGPSLVGAGLEGFGSSSFACGGKLFVTTMSGVVQQLAPSGENWTVAGQLQRPRFFHRMLPWNDQQLVIVGGASMGTGKITQLELLPVSGNVQSASK
jgi:N-acetylneuraminic acid mutarotase